MSYRSTTLRPGLLVNVHTSISGGIQYQTNTIDFETVDANGELRAKWETEKVIFDAAEFERAVKLRARARNLIARVCSKSDFGLLCPKVNEPALKSAVIEARALADEFNITAKHSRSSVDVMTGEVSQSDAEAVRSINGEISRLFQYMEDGIKALDPVSIREAANRAKQLAQMLNADANARIQVAIDAARDAAKQIVKAGEQAADAVDEIAIEQIAAMRTSFLEYEAEAVQAPTEVGRGVDFDAEISAADGEVATTLAEVRAPEIEMSDDDKATQKYQSQTAGE